jgi:hypothetical protein
MRNPGRRSSQLALVPPTPIDCRLGRPPAPEALSEDERVLWEKLVLARRPQWFLGAEAVSKRPCAKRGPERASGM